MMRIAAAEAMERLGYEIAAATKAGDVIALSGNLGVGKSVLARGVAHGLGFPGDVASPTFPIVQVYDEAGMRLPLWHVDLYRIEEETELEELALDEARSYAVLVIEWPERLGNRLWREALQIEIRREEDDARALTAHVPPAWESRWPPR